MTQAAGSETIETQGTLPVEEEQTEYRAIKMPIDGIIRSVAGRFGDKGKEVERFLKFGTVGTIGAFVDLGTMNLLQATILPPVDEFDKLIGFTIPIGDGVFISINVILAVTISFIAAISSNFFWNRYWTYPDSRTRSVRRQMSQFATVSVIGWIARTIWIQLSYQSLGGLAVTAIQSVNPSFLATTESTAKLGTNMATFIGIFIIMIWNFFANRYWTYNDVD